MNNAYLALQNIEEGFSERKVVLQQREGLLVKIIESVKSVEGTKEWSSLKKLVFDGLVETLKKELLYEATKDIPDQLKLAKVNGQLIWAKRYADLSKYADSLRIELASIRKTLYGKSPND